MKTTTSNFDTYNALLYKQPVFIVEIGAYTTKFVTGTFNNIGSYTTKKYVVHISGTDTALDIYQSELTSATYTIRILDKNSEFTSFFNTNSLLNQTLKILAGFQEIDYADFTQITPSSTIITRIYLEEDKITWVIEARDSLFNLSNAIFNRKYGQQVSIDSTLNGDLTDVETTSMTLISTTNYDAQTDIDNGINVDNRVFTCVKIDNEIIQYTGVSGATLTTLTRGVGNTTPAAHSTATQVLRGIGFKCDPLRAMLHLLTTSDAGTNGKYDLAYDSGWTSNYVGLSNVSGWASEIDVADIQVENIERMGYRLFNNFEYDSNNAFLFVFFNDNDKAFDFITERILKPHGLFFRLNDNKLDVESGDLVYFTENFSADDSLTDANIIDLNNINITELNEAHDRYIAYYNYNHATANFATKASKQVNDLFTAYGITSEFDVNYYGIPSSGDIDQIGKLFVYRFSAFMDVMTKFNVDLFDKQLLLEAGDRLAVTYTNYPDVNTGSRGLSSAKIVAVGSNFDITPESFHLQSQCLFFDSPGTVRRARGNEVFYAINKVAEGSIDDTSLSVSADETATTEAADAYYDNSVSAYTADLIIFFIRLTEPNYGAGSDMETISLKFSWLDNVPSIQRFEYRDYIRFNPQGTSVFTFPVFMYGKSTNADTPDRVKVDWISTTAAGSEIPTVEFVGVWFVDWDQNIAHIF